MSGMSKRRWHLRLQWEPRDCWIGLYWTRATYSTHVYICLLPCFPLHVWWMTAPEPPYPGGIDSSQAAQAKEQR